MHFTEEGNKLHRSRQKTNRTAGERPSVCAYMLGTSGHGPNHHQRILNVLEFRDNGTHVLRYMSRTQILNEAREVCKRAARQHDGRFVGPGVWHAPETRQAEVDFPQGLQYIVPAAPTTTAITNTTTSTTTTTAATTTTTTNAATTTTQTPTSATRAAGFAYPHQTLHTQSTPNREDIVHIHTPQDETGTEVQIGAQTQVPHEQTQVTHNGTASANKSLIIAHASKALLPPATDTLPVEEDRGPRNPRESESNESCDEDEAHEWLECDQAQLDKFEELTPSEVTTALKGGLLVRDMRKIDPTFLTSKEASFVVRKHAIISAVKIKAVVVHRKCYIITPDGSDQCLAILMDRLRKPPIDECVERMPFEFRALEAIFASILAILETELKDLQKVVQKTCKGLNLSVSALTLDHLRQAKKHAAAFTEEIQGAREAVYNFLQSDEDMAHAYLSRLYEQPELWEGPFDDHEEMEYLLETYLEALDSIATTVKLIDTELDDNEHIIELGLDAARNRLIKTDLVISVLSMTMAFGAMVAGFFGMNVPSGLENTYGVFAKVIYVTGIASASVVVMIAFIFWKLRLFV